MSERLVKAQLKPADQGQGGDAIDFMFNPSQLAFGRTIQLNQPRGARTGQGIPKISFAYPNPYSLKISNILLDTYEAGTNVMEYVDKFRAAVEFSQQGEGRKKRPPIYLFTWGEQEYLRCFVKSLNYKLTLFLPDGTPVRAMVDLELQEVDETVDKPATGTPQPSSAQRQSDQRR